MLRKQFLPSKEVSILIIISTALYVFYIYVCLLALHLYMLGLYLGAHSPDNGWLHSFYISIFARPMVHHFGCQFSTLCRILSYYFL